MNGGPPIHSMFQFQMRPNPLAPLAKTVDHNANRELDQFAQSNNSHSNQQSMNINQPKNPIHHTSHPYSPMHQQLAPIHQSLTPLKQPVPANPSPQILQQVNQPSTQRPHTAHNQTNYIGNPATNPAQQTQSHSSAHTPLQLNVTRPTLTQPPLGVHQPMPVLYFPYPYHYQQNWTMPGVSDTLSPSTAKLTQVPTSATSAGSVLASTENLLLDEIVRILTAVEPSTVREYSEHVYKIAAMLNDHPKGLSPAQLASLNGKFCVLLSHIDRFTNTDDPINSKLHLVVERNFDVLVKISINHANVDLGTRTIRFLTSLMMALNYWEVYNLLVWKPAIYRFLQIIRFDLNDCYRRFISDYARFNYTRVNQPNALPRRIRARRRAKRALEMARRRAESSELRKDNPYYESELLSELLSAKDRRKLRHQGLLVSHKVVKRAKSPNLSLQDMDTLDLRDDTPKGPNKSSNYDPDVVHECQLPSADEPNKMCMRRFSRKYELIRHQETVHSKKKKLFKCFVCVKQNPQVGPRIFTRHDTLAKHIRVNHKISGKEAKQEVAYLKKNAEIVDEGDITVHVGRRKTKVDFELRAHMEKKKLEKGESLDDLYSEEESEEEVTFN